MCEAIDPVDLSQSLGHTFLFYVLQDFVLKIAYGRSKKERKKGVNCSIFCFTNHRAS